MTERKPRRWLRRLLIAAIAVTAIAAMLWFINIWRLTRERDRMLAEAEKFGPVLWKDLAAQTLAEQRKNPGAAEEFLAAIARLGGDYGRTLGFPMVFDGATGEWLETSPAPPLPDHAVKALARGKDLLDRLHRVAGKQPGLVTTALETDHPGDTQLGQIQDVRDSARLLYLEALAAKQAGDVRRAYRTALTASRLTRHLERDPFLMTWLIAAAIENIAVQQVLTVALRTGRPTAEEFAALDAVWANRGPVDNAFANAVRHDTSMWLAVARHPKDWAWNRRQMLQENGRKPSRYELAMLTLEGTGAGDPVRRRAEIGSLELRIALEQHLAADHDMAQFDFRRFADASGGIYAWRRNMPTTAARRRSLAFAARQALRLARQWYETGKLPDSADDLGLPPLPNAVAPTYERRPRGFTLRIDYRQLAASADELFIREIVVEFPALKPNTGG